MGFAAWRPTGVKVKENRMLKRKIRNLAVTGITIVSATLLAVLGTTGALADVTAAASPGHAAVTTAASAPRLAAAPAGAAAPANRLSPEESICPVYGGHVYFYFSGCAYDSSPECVSGLQGFINGDPGLYPRYVSNGCNWRVWIYSGVNRTGNNLCVNPRTADQYLHRNYIWFWISSNGTNC
jgi:hypothetical protein